MNIPKWLIVTLVLLMLLPIPSLCFWEPTDNFDCLWAALTFISIPIAFGYISTLDKLVHVHMWSFWKKGKLSLSNCKYRHCVSCNEYQYSGTHIFSNLDPKTCDHVLICAGCGKTEHLVNHDFQNKIVIDLCREQLTCTKCGKKQDIEHHDYQEREMNGCWVTVMCTRCDTHDLSVPDIQRHDENYNLHGYCERCGYFDYQGY